MTETKEVVGVGTLKHFVCPWDCKVQESPLGPRGDRAKKHGRKLVLTEPVSRAHRFKAL